MGAICGQNAGNITTSGQWIDLCGISPNSFITSPAIVQQPAAQLPGNPLTVGGYSEKNLRRMVQFAQPSPGEREARQESRVPGTGEVLIDVELAPLNLHDLLFIRGYFGGPPVPTVAGDEEVVG